MLEIVCGLRSPLVGETEVMGQFVADCLETIEELGIRAVKSFRESGAEVLTLVPEVNASDAWADAVVTLSREGSAWLPSPGLARHA